MTKSTILDSLNVYREYINGDDSHVEVVHVSMPVKAKDHKIMYNSV